MSTVINSKFVFSHLLSCFLCFSIFPTSFVFLSLPLCVSPRDVDSARSQGREKWGSRAGVLGSRVCQSPALGPGVLL